MSDDNVTPIGGAPVVTAPDQPPADAAPQPIETAPPVASEPPAGGVLYTELVERLKAAEAAIASFPENSYDRLHQLEATMARASELVTMLVTLALRYHHQEVVAMQPPAAVDQPGTVPNALHIPS